MSAHGRAWNETVFKVPSKFSLRHSASQTLAGICCLYKGSFHGAVKTDPDPKVWDGTREAQLWNASAKGCRNFSLAPGSAVVDIHHQHAHAKGFVFFWEAGVF